MNFITKLLISSIAVVITAYFLDGVTIGDNQFYNSGPPELNKFTTAVLVAVVLAFLNTIVKPILTILSLPITFFTLGLFLLVINAIIVLICDYFIPEFQVDGFVTALFFSILLSLSQSILNKIFVSDK